MQTRLAVSGAKALLVIERSVGLDPARSAGRLADAYYFRSVPSARILHADGLFIRREGVRRARIAVRTSATKSHSYNVMGDLAGTSHPDDIVVVCAHYDSLRDIPGAAITSGWPSVHASHSDSSISEMDSM